MANFTDNSDCLQVVTAVSGTDVWMIKLKVPDAGSVELLKYRSHPWGAPEQRRSCLPFDERMRDSTDAI